jgi:hypothetical protein
VVDKEPFGSIVVESETPEGRLLFREDCLKGVKRLGEEVRAGEVVVDVCMTDGDGRGIREGVVWFACAW